MSDVEGLSRRPVYLDHHATTPVDRRVLDAMLPYFSDCFGNASSVDHEYGAHAARAVEVARTQVANLLNAQSDEIIFTSGATEADNLALIGVTERYAGRGDHIITCVTEHKAVLDTCAFLQTKGWRVTYLPVDSYGLIDPDDVHHAITARTVLISVMVANNEIGTIAPIAEIGRIAREHEILFHTDAAQAAGYIVVDVEAGRIDLLSLSAHKMYGPKGIGALYVRKRGPRVHLAELIHGGGHERGMRSGTLNVPGIVGLGRAAELIHHERDQRFQHLRQLRDQLWHGLQSGIGDIELNGHPTQRLPHNLSVAIPQLDARSLSVHLKRDIAFSTGAACATLRTEPSHVILATGCDEERALRTIRLGLGLENTASDIALATTRLVEGAQRLRTLLSP